MALARVGPCTALGHGFTLESTDSDLIDAIGDMVAPLLAATEPLATKRYSIITAADPESRYQLFRNGEQVGKVASFARLAAGLFWCLDRDIAATPPAGHVLFHAAAVASDGRAVVLPGASGSGKSTLAARLAADGMAYLTDEVSAVSVATGDVLPYPKPLSLKPGSWPFFPKLEPPPAPGPSDAESPWQVPATRLGPGGIAGTTPLAALIFPEYRPGGEARCERLPTAEAFVALAQCSFVGRPPDARELSALGGLARRTPCYRIRYSRLDHAADAVRDVVDRT